MVDNVTHHAKYCRETCLLDTPNDGASVQLVDLDLREPGSLRHHKRMHTVRPLHMCAGRVEGWRGLGFRGWGLGLEAQGV
jgi:hypothetical protein